MRASDRIRRRPTQRAGRTDDGFLLVESIVAVAVVTIVMTALATLLMTANSVTTRQRSAQTASRLAVSALDRARAIGAAGAVSGRDATTSNTQLTTTPATPDFPATTATVAPWLATMSPAVDSTARVGDGRTAAVPTVPVHQTVDGHTFSISYFVGYCWRLPSGGTGDCVRAKSDGAIQYVRVVVAVAWPGTACGSAGCSFVSATLLNGSGDPVFNVNQATAPKLTMNAVPTQYTAPGATVTGLTGVAGCASPCPVSASGGAPPFTFTATGLPAGLSMDSTGVVTGTAPASKGATTVTVTVTDAFLNTATTSFTWAISTPLTFDQPADRTDTVGSKPSVAMTGAAGGAGAPYAWSATGLPPGLSINATTGVISGTVAQPDRQPPVYSPTVTVRDGSGATGVRTFTWTVKYRPLSVATAPNRTSTKGRSISPVDLSGLVSGGSGSVQWSDPSSTLPSGLTVSSSGLVTGTPASTGTSSVKLTVRDTLTGETASVPFTWTVGYAPLSVSSPGDQSDRRGQYVRLDLSGNVAGGSGSVTWSDTGWSGTLPPGLSISSGGVISGTTPNTTDSWNVTLRVRDTITGETVSVSFRWAVSRRG